MEDLFRSYWWLLFPLGWFVAAGFQSLMRYRRQKDTLNLLKHYADKGQDPPAELLRSLTSDERMEAAVWGVDPERPAGPGNSGWPWPANVALFTVLAAGFGYATYVDLYGAGEAFTIVTFVMGAMALAFLVSGIFARKRP